MLLMGFNDEFVRGKQWVEEHFADSVSKTDINVDSFELNIRLLGGLLGAHVMEAAMPHGGGVATTPSSPDVLQRLMTQSSFLKAAIFLAADTVTSHLRS